MAFMPYRVVDTEFAHLRQFNAAAGDYKIGMTLTMDNGQLTLSPGSPDYMCMCQRAGTAAGELVPVMPVSRAIIWITTSPSLLVTGNYYTVASDGLSITATQGGRFFAEEAYEENGTFYVIGRFAEADAA